MASISLLVFAVLLSLQPIMIFSSSINHHPHQQLSKENNIECLSLIINITQSCQNNNILYFTSPMGFNNGLASEFNHYFVISTLGAILSGKRLVYLRSNRTWEYDCDFRSGWGCYFRFRCGHPRGVEPKDMNFTTSLSGSFVNPGTTFQSTTPGYGKFMDFSRILNAYKKIKKIDSNLQCNGINISTTVATSIVAKYLYQLQPEVKSSIKQINTRYHHLTQSGYFSLQIRLTDKKMEMPRETWKWMNNATSIANYMKPFFDADPEIKNLFIGNEKYFHYISCYLSHIYISSNTLLSD